MELQSIFLWAAKRRIDNINPVKVSSNRSAIVTYSGQDNRAEAVTNIKICW